MALLHLRTMDPGQGMLARWLSELSTMDFEVQHRPGKANVDADALSRSKHLDETIEQDELEAQAYNHMVAGCIREIQELNQEMGQRANSKVCEIEDNENQEDSEPAEHRDEPQVNEGQDVRSAQFGELAIVKDQEEDEILKVVKGWVKMDSVQVKEIYEASIVKSSGTELSLKR